MNKFDGFKLTPSLDSNSNKNEDFFLLIHSNVCRVRSTCKFAKNKKNEYNKLRNMYKLAKGKQKHVAGSCYLPQFLTNLIEEKDEKLNIFFRLDIVVIYLIQPLDFHFFFMI